MTFREFLKNNIVILDGGMGTLLQAKGLKPGEHPELWNITNRDAIIEIHKGYFDAGSNVINTNTFGANSLKFSQEELEKIISCAIENAKIARDSSSGKQEKFVSLDIGPLGRLLKPLGDLEFENAVSIFSDIVRLGVKYGVDLITIETMNDSYETKAALLAVKESCDLPVIVTNAYGEDGKLLTGASPAAMVALLEGMGADAIGANCSLGPKQLIDIADELLKYSSIPIIMKPNAGLPCVRCGHTEYDVTPLEFADIVVEMIRRGVRCIGGCCGTTPEYIALLKEQTINIFPHEIINKNKTCVSSYGSFVEFENTPILIGERINPTGKKRFKQALIEHDLGYILSEGLKQQDKGVHILDVNVGLPGINEPEILCEVIQELQAVCELPLQIDTSDYTAMEKAMRIYNGKPLVNSVNGKAESMKQIFPLVKKYGGAVIALTLDENGIPESSFERLEIAKRIISTAAQYGISSKDIIFDTLALTVSADNNAARVTLESLNLIKNKLGCHTSLGVSNVSFGLPSRDFINSTFFTLALANGLSAAIMNPYSEEILRAYYSYMALIGADVNCEKYIEYTSTVTTADTPAQASIEKKVSVIASDNTNLGLKETIIKGLREQAYKITAVLLETRDYLEIVNSEIIPALDFVGKGFENKTMFLPQLLMSAEAAKCSFEAIKDKQKFTSENCRKVKIVIATVKGDIHDIGKNIVRLILENYGFSVIDLGKDVSEKIIVDAIIENKADICGLSALMTTTVPAMQNTIELIKKEVPGCKVMVGGAVLTEKYAESIGADKYAKDAMEAVRYAVSVDETL